MSKYDEIREHLGDASKKVDEAIGRAIARGDQDAAQVLLEAGEIIDAAIDDLGWAE